MQPSSIYPWVAGSVAAVAVLVLVTWLSSRTTQTATAGMPRATTPVISGLFIYPIKGSHGHSVSSACIDEFGLQHDRRWMVVRGSTGDFLTQRQISLLAAITADVCQPPDRASLLHADVARCPRRREAVTQPSLLLHTPLCTYAHGAAPSPCDCLMVPLLTSESSRTRSTIWRKQVEGVCDQGDAAAAWLCAHLRSDDLRLVYMAEHCARMADDDFTPAAHAQRVSFADGYPLLLLSEESVADVNTHVKADGEAGVPINRFRTNVLLRGVSAPYAEDTWASVRIGPCVHLLGVKRCSRCRVTTIPQETTSWQRDDSGVSVRAGSADAQPLETLRRIRGDAKGNVYMGMNCIVDRSVACACGAGACPRRISVGDSVHVLHTAVIPPQ